MQRGQTWVSLNQKLKNKGKAEVQLKYLASQGILKF